MVILCAFLSGMSFVIAVAACVAVRQEQARARSCEQALSGAMAEQAALIVKLASSDGDLERMIRAVAAASTPPVLPVDQKQVFISVPGPRTRQ